VTRVEDPLAPLKAVCVPAPPRVSLDAAALRDVVEDPGFQRRLRRGALNVAAIAQALVNGKAARGTEEFDGRGRDDTRRQLEELRRQRPKATRTKVTRLFRALVTLRAGDRCREHELSGITWQHAADLLLTLLEDFPELALGLPKDHQTGRDARAVAAPMVLTRRNARDPLAAIQKRVRTELRAAGLPAHLVGRALKAAGISRR